MYLTLLDNMEILLIRPSMTYADRSCAYVISRCVVLFQASSIRHFQTSRTYESRSTHKVTAYGFYTLSVQARTAVNV